MSKRIFELNKAIPGVIIGKTKEHPMDYSYVEHLEKLVQKMLPVYNRYYEIMGIQKPVLEQEVVLKATRTIPALFKPK
jgi:hypothetical protein